MTPQPVTVRPTDELADVAALLLDHGVRAAPVVESGRLVGIVSRHDVLRCVAQRRPVAHRAATRGGDRILGGLTDRPTRLLSPKPGHDYRLSRCRISVA